VVLPAMMEEVIDLSAVRPIGQKSEWMKAGQRGPLTERKKSDRRSAGRAKVSTRLGMNVETRMPAGMRPLSDYREMGNIRRVAGRNGVKGQRDNPEPGFDAKENE
jgi:hypothetical protein